MEVQFKQIQHSCMDAVVSRVQTSEQTQEIRIGDGMPDVGYIIGAWGQPILRSKEWHDSYFTFSGGMMVWVLYGPEDGTQPRTVSSWIPFHFRWELPGDTPEGVIRITCLNRFVDARSVSPGKIMVRSGMAALGQAFAPKSFAEMSPVAESDQIQMLVRTYPLQLMKEAGEKVFLLEEELTLTESLPAIKEILCCHLDSKTMDSRVLSDKLAFRGTQQLHVVYRSEEDQVHAWDFELPYSQFVELGNIYGSEASGDICLCATTLEPELTDERHLRIKCGLVAQYLICDREAVCVAEDAFDPSVELMTRQEELTVPVILDQGKLSISPEHTMEIRADVAVDACFLPDFPSLSEHESGTELRLCGNFQLLYYAEDRKLHGTSARWEGQEPLKLHREADLAVIPEPGQVQSYAGSGSVQLKAEASVRYTALARQQIPMLTRIQTGQPKNPDPGRPSLIIRRCGEESLWEIAKSSGSSVERIRQANGLEGECQPGKLLMIPIP